jgi:quercetin 2,3-dioxygenase
MSNKIQRRNFLSRVTLAFGAALIAPVQHFSNSVKRSLEDKSMNPVLKTAPLGFMWDTQNPFLFCAHHEDYFPKGNDQLGPAASLAGRSIGDDFIIKDGFRMYHGKTVPGFPGHPHRGFETITIVRKGIVDHADSLGAAGRYGNGDVQWMTAGKGVQHSEMFPLLKKEEENPLELFQIWLNLPKKDKMVEPHFKMLWRESIPNVEYKDDNQRKSTVEIIAGNFSGTKAPEPAPDSWAAKAENDVAIWNIKMSPEAELKLPAAAATSNRVLYFYEGDALHISDTVLDKYSSAVVKPDVDLILKAGKEAVSILVLQGKPIDEPVIQYGPFVMNTKEEIHQAFADYHQTQFGGWPWSRYDQVHDIAKTRFARHADGSEEVKEI